MSKPPIPMPVQGEFQKCIEQVAAASPGTWQVREGRDPSQFFVQAPRLSPEHPYDIEVLGEDDTLYPTRRADADAIVGLVNFVRKFGPELAGALEILRATTTPIDPQVLVEADVASHNLRKIRYEDQADAIDTLIKAAPRVEMVSVQEAWVAAGGNPGIKPDRAELFETLRMMDEAVDEADEAPRPRPGM